MQSLRIKIARLSSVVVAIDNVGLLEQSTALLVLARYPAAERSREDESEQLDNCNGSSGSGNDDNLPRSAILHQEKSPETHLRVKVLLKLGLAAFQSGVTLPAVVPRARVLRSIGDVHQTAAIELQPKVNDAARAVAAV